MTSPFRLRVVDDQPVMPSGPRPRFRDHPRPTRVAEPDTRVTFTVAPQF